MGKKPPRNTSRDSGRTSGTPISQSPSPMAGLMLNLHPVVIILVVRIGALTYGVVGAFLAVPLTACLARIIDYLRGRPPSVGPRIGRGRRRRSWGQPPAPEQRTGTEGIDVPPPAAAVSAPAPPEEDERSSGGTAR
jgi:putative heme transporter